MPFTRVAASPEALPPYLFIEIDKKKRALMAAGKDVINLGVGDPDLPTHKFVIDEMAQRASATQRTTGIRLTRACRRFGRRW